MSTSHYRAIVKRLQDQDKRGKSASDVEQSSSRPDNDTEASDAYFFQGAQRQHNLETLRHLAVFGDLILLLTGIAGAGKTALLSRAESELKGDVHVVMVRPDASQGTDSHSLVKLVAHQSAIFESASESKQSLVERVMASYSALREQTGKRTLLVVDDADRCNEGDLSLLVSAVESQAEDGAVVLLLSAQPSFMATVFGLGNRGRDYFHQVHLKSLSEGELFDYIQGGLSAEGYKGALELDSQAQHRLYERSKGVPKLIDASLASILFGTKSRSEKKVSAPAAKLPTRILVAIVATLVLSFLFVAYQHGLFVGLYEGAETVFVDDKQLTQEITEESAARAERMALLDKALEQSKKFEEPSFTDLAEGSSIESKQAEELVDQEASVAAAKDVQAEVLATEELTESDAASGAVLDELSQGSQAQEVWVNEVANLFPQVFELEPELVVADRLESESLPGLYVTKGENLEQEGAQAEGAASLIEPVALVDGALDVTVVSTAGGTSTGVSSENVASSVVKHEATIKTVSVLKSTSKHAAFRDEGWLAGQPAGNYTLQVLGSFFEDKVHDFIDRTRFSELIYVQLTHKGKPWYVVLHGNFSAKSQADKAVLALPQKVASKRPWVRSFSSMQPK